MGRLLVVVAFGVAGAASAASFRSGDQIVVSQGQVVGDDLYAFGQTVLIEGEVQGDVVASGAKIRVTGRVHGDLIAAARSVQVDGRVDGSIRSASAELVLNGKVGKDAVIAGQTLEIAPQATVAGDVAAAGGTVRLLGTVGRDVRAGGGRLELGGPVGGAVQAHARNVSIGQHADLQGPLEYSSAQQAQIPEGAHVSGVQWQPMERRPAGPVWFFVGWLRLSIGLFALGLLARLVAPKLSREAPATLRSRPWRSLGIGTLALFAAPIVGSMLFGLGLLLGGWWLAVLLFAALLVAVSLAFPTVGQWAGQSLLGRLARTRVRLAATLAVGVVLLALAIRIPFVGALVLLAAMLFGLGALLLAGWHLRHAPAPT